MAQKISQMTEQSTASMTEAGTSDFLGGYTTTGGNANRKFSLSGLANYFLNKFKMTLGGSSQTVKSAIDALNSNKMPSLVAFNNPTVDANALTPGLVYAGNGSTNVPELYIFIWTYRVGNYWSQFARSMTGQKEWMRYSSGTNPSGEWALIPTRAEVDALNSKYLDNAGAHNAIYRGKYLGTSVTEAQWSAISSGAFTDLYIGDYWTINGVNWRIAAFDYWLNCGDTNCTTHHVVIVPDSNLHSAKMNDTDVTTGAYLGSDFYTGNNDNTGRADAITKVNNAFGSSHILTHRELLTNATSNGYASGGTWVDATVELMSERMVYGNAVFENMISGTNIPYDYTIDKSQLPLFAHEPSRICNRGSWWLRSVASSAYFSFVDLSGAASRTHASHSFGVRPAFGIK